MNDRFGTFTMLIAKIGRNIKRLKSYEVAEFNLKGPHVSCLYHIYVSENGITAAEIADRCEEDKSAISRNLDYLEEIGLITCDVQGNKKYRAILKLTDEGRRVCDSISEKIDKILAVSANGITDQELSIMYKALLAISENLDNLVLNDEKI